MIEIKKGDLLKSNADVIVHQTNCLGIMGSGVAYQIKKKYPQVFQEYYKFCKEYYDNNNLSELLGNVLFVKSDNKIIANCFGQYGIGKGVQTNYDALLKCFYEVWKFASRYENITIAMPYKIGCGLAGGDWTIVYRYIQQIFGDSSSIKCELYKLEE